MANQDDCCSHPRYGKQNLAPAVTIKIEEVPLRTMLMFRTVINHYATANECYILIVYLYITIIDYHTP